MLIDYFPNRSGQKARFLAGFFRALKGFVTDPAKNRVIWPDIVSRAIVGALSGQKSGHLAGSTRSST